MMLVRTYIAPSEIQGLGVFAGEFIPGGSHLWVLNPKFDIFLYREEIATLPAHMQDYVARYSYPHLKIDGVRIVDCDDGKFMNHKVRPNTDFGPSSGGVRAGAAGTWADTDAPEVLDRHRTRWRRWRASARHWRGRCRGSGW